MYLKVETTDAANKLSELLKDGDWMVLYYAEWCGHCNAMKPEWEKVIEKLKESGKINIADVKSDVIDSLLHKPKIEGFPTIKMYNKGREIAKFEDERSAEKLEKFAISNSSSVKTPSKIVSQQSIDNNTVPTKKEEEIKINLEELENVPTPIIDNNSNEIKKLSISQLKDKIMKSHSKSKVGSIKLGNTVNNNVVEIKNEDKPINTIRASKNQIANLGNLNMLLQPPANSIKASKKATLIKPKPKPKAKAKPKSKSKSKSKTQIQTQILPQMNGTKGIPNNMRNNKVAEDSPMSSLECADIRKAKMCKTNPKCFYDYVEFKCKDKSERQTPELKLNNRNKGAKHSKKNIEQKQSQKQSQINKKDNATRELLQALQKSFKKIGNEARNDANLISKVSERI